MYDRYEDTGKDEPLRFAPDLYSLEAEAERFIAICRNENVKFEAHEWADDPEKEPVSRGLSKPDKLEKTDYFTWIGWKGEPNCLIRVVCQDPGCGKEKDCWLDENGSVEDSRDKWCHHADGSAYKTEPCDDLA